MRDDRLAREPGVTRATRGTYGVTLSSDLAISLDGIVGKSTNGAQSGGGNCATENRLDRIRLPKMQQLRPPSTEDRGPRS